MNRPTWTRVLTDARKFGVALVGVVGAALAQGLIPDPWARWAAVVVAVGVALGVYRVENTGTVPADRLEDARAGAYTLGRVDQASGRPHRYVPTQKGPSHL